MGHDETVGLNVGLRIRIRDVLLCLTEDNVKDIWNFLVNEENLIDDENEWMNKSYQTNIVDYFESATLGGASLATVCDNELHLKLKIDELVSRLQKYGNTVPLRGGGKEQITFDDDDDNDDNESLYNAYILVGTNFITGSTRYGWDRHFDTTATGADLDMNKLHDMRKNAEDYAHKMGFRTDSYKVSLILSHTGC